MDSYGTSIHIYSHRPTATDQGINKKDTYADTKPFPLGRVHERKSNECKAILQSLWLDNTPVNLELAKPKTKMPEEPANRSGYHGIMCNSLTS
jgi:hypothetical protein